MLDDSDETLMVQAGTGNREAGRVLVERHLGRVLAFAERILGNRSEAEDAAQDVFLRLWNAAPHWQHGSARFTTWLYRVAMNVCLDRMAKKREAPADDFPELADPTPEPSLALHNAQMAQHVGTALAALPEAQRIALTLCHYQGFRNAEAADIMEISVVALESLLARGRRSLRARLARIAPALLGS